MRSLVITATIVATTLSPDAFAAEQTLQNDGFATGSPVSFQAGFVAGEIAAARFIPAIVCPCHLTSLTLLFGGSEQTRNMDILVWEDLAGSATPGGLLYSGTVGLTGSNVNLQMVDLSLTPIIVNGPFRVGLEFGHNGLPSVASDLDGSIDAAANFILADFGALLWFSSASLGVSGDFVIRATISNDFEPDIDQDGISDSMDNCLFVANPDQRDTNGDNYGNLCDADLTDDCIVNFADLNVFRTVFFGNDADADLNGDGIVNFADLSVVRKQFFRSPGPSGLTTICD